MQPRNARLAALVLAGLFASWAGYGAGRAYGDPPNDARPAAPAPPGAAKAQIANFRTPREALDAFLAASKARDPARLREATALHAPLEAVPANQHLFAAVLDLKLSGEDLEELAFSLEGFEVVDEGTPKRGLCTLTLLKRGRDGTRSVLRVSTRHEKAGWKVQDISLPRGREGWNVDDLRRYG